MVTSTEEPSVQPQEEMDLTDEQIQQLLLEAEGRLRGPLVQATKGTEDAVFKYVDAAVVYLSCASDHELMCYQDPEVVFWGFSRALYPPG